MRGDCVHGRSPLSSRVPESIGGTSISRRIEVVIKRGENPRLASSIGECHPSGAMCHGGVVPTKRINCSCDQSWG